MASKVKSKYKNLLLWIPDGMDPNDKTREIAETMKTNFKINEIDKTEYNDHFRDFYNTHIRPYDTIKSTFCLKEGHAGVNIEYLIKNASKSNFVTLMSVNSDHFDDQNIDVNAIVIFRWAKTPNALKIQVLCADQRKKGTGDGTKLLNIIKKTLTSMDLNDIYLNPIDVAVPYYVKQNFRNTLNSDKIIHDSSDPKPKSKSHKSKTKSKTKPANNASIIPSMTMNLRARRNWNKTKTKFKAISVLRENIHRPMSRRASQTKHKYSPIETEHNSSQDSPRTARSKKLLLKVDEVVSNLSGDERENVTFNDIIELLEKENIRNITEKDEDIIRPYVSDKYSIENY